MGSAQASMHVARRLMGLAEKLFPVVPDRAADA